VVVDTLGLLWAVLVTAANVQDRDGAKQVLECLVGRMPRLRLVWADGAYAGELVQWVSQVCGWLLHIVLKPLGQRGFVVLPKRWIVERTFAWLVRYRRLGKDYEYLPASSEAMLYIAMIHLMVRRLRC
jgi:putative transposase